MVVTHLQGLHVTLNACRGPCAASEPTHWQSIHPGKRKGGPPAARVRDPQAVPEGGRGDLLFRQGRDGQPMEE